MTPLERAVRALCEVRGADGWPLLNADPDFGDYPLSAEGTGDTNPFTEADVLAMVRAVIEAIREPSEDMAMQAFVVGGVGGLGVYQHMIDVLLNEKLDSRDTSRA